MFNFFKKLSPKSKPPEPRQRHTIERCLDCGVENGELHDLFCTKERCPFCGGQLITCDCICSVLKLSPDEVQILEKFADDSIPPLSEIMQRWKQALEHKGRIPFKSFPDDSFRAAYRGDLEAVQRFLEDGIQVNTPNDVGYTMLMAAARGESFAMIRLLLAHGGQPAQADTRGYTALHWVVAQSTSDSSRQVTCLTALVDAGGDPNVCNQEGFTPLMNAAWFGCSEAVRELLRRGADPLKRDSKGKTARDFASQRGHKVIEEILK